MSEPHQPSSRAIWRHRLAVLKLFGRAIFNPTYRLGFSAIVRFHGYCAVAMAILCFLGALMGKAPLGNAVGGVIFALAAVLLLRVAKVIRPTEIPS